MEVLSVPLVEAPVCERDLLRRAQSGDLEAFEDLYRENAGRVYALCLRMSGDPALARDLTQDTFLRAWERIRSFRGESQFATWIHRIAVNVVLGERRSAGSRGALTFEEKDLERIEAPASRPEPGRMRELEDAIAALPTEARRVFVLHDIEGYRHEEISALTGRSVGTSKSQLHRARRLLREALR